MATLSQEQTVRITEVMANLSRVWATLENPVITGRGMFGLFPRVPGPLEEAFSKAGATVQLNYAAQAQRGAAANLRVIAGAIGRNLYYVARCMPAAEDGAFNIEFDLSPQREPGDEADDALVSEGMLAVCEDLLGDGLLTMEGFGAFIRRQIVRSNHARPKMLAALAGVLSDELNSLAGEESNRY